jgi:hypothetical protein
MVGFYFFKKNSTNREGGAHTHPPPRGALPVDFKSTAALGVCGTTSSLLAPATSKKKKGCTVEGMSRAAWRRRKRGLWGA